MMDLLRRTILRAIVIVGTPFVFVMFWLTGSVQWRREFREAWRSMWRADRGRDWSVRQ